MKIAVLLVFFAVGLAALRIPEEELTQKLFSNFKRKYNKVYRNDQHQARYLIFKVCNLPFISNVIRPTTCLPFTRMNDTTLQARVSQDLVIGLKKKEQNCS
jgi:hypothetical protein